MALKKLCISVNKDVNQHFLKITNTWNEIRDDLSNYTYVPIAKKYFWDEKIFQELIKVYVLILHGSYNEKIIIYDDYEDALRNFEKHRESGRTCYLTKVVMSSVK